MKPYYQDDLVTLYLGDCREITEWLTADVLVTDPPYGRNWTGTDYNGGAGSAGIVGDIDAGMRDAALSMFTHGPAIVFGDPLIAAPDTTRQALIYAKPPGAGFMGTMAGYFRDVEMIFLCGPWSNAKAERSSVIRSGASYGGLSAKAYGHPHAKPVDVMEYLIRHCPPGTVADPFAGSGSTLVAAKLLGREAIGVEIDERYCEIAARRLLQDALPFEAGA